MNTQPFITDFNDQPVMVLQWIYLSDIKELCDQNPIFIDKEKKITQDSCHMTSAKMTQNSCQDPTIKKSIITPRLNVSTRTNLIEKGLEELNKLMKN